MFGAWWAAARAAPASTPLVASEHNQYLWPGRPPTAEMREALGRVDVFFAHGPSARATVIAHGLRLDRVREGISPVIGTEARPAPGLPSPRIVFAGRLDPDKGPDILVEALGLLRDPPPTLILGDGRLRAPLQRRVRELGLAKRVSFHGWVSDPGPYIAGATVLAIPSRDEAFSQTAIIGLAHGVPVIGTEVDGFPATQLTWSEGAMTPAGLAAVCAEAAGRRRRRIVECGSGFSTLVLARLLHTRGGRLVSLEHDQTWATRVRSNLAAAGLAEIAQVALAPLAPRPLARDGLQWYAQHALRSLPRRIDLLLVDGPPAFEPEIELSRYPALPALAERLAPDATVVLDDIDRRGELRILDAWERDCGFRFEVRPAERIAVGRRR